MEIYNKDFIYFHLFIVNSSENFIRKVLCKYYTIINDIQILYYNKQYTNTTVKI